MIGPYNDKRIFGDIIPVPINDCLRRRVSDMNMTTMKTSQEMRTSCRIPIHGQGELLDAATDRGIAIELVDISDGGICFLSTARLQKNSIWLVRFELNGKELRGSVRITHCAMHIPTEIYRAGAEFKEWESAHLLTIKRFLA